MNFWGPLLSGVMVGFSIGWFACRYITRKELKIVSDFMAQNPTWKLK